MTMQYKVEVRNAWLDELETRILAAGGQPVFEVRSGAQPANCAAADSGTLLASITCPADPMAAASSGSKAKSGTWEDTSANATGTAGHFRWKDSAGVCWHQGSITATGGGGDAEIDSTSITAGQKVTVTTFTLTAPGA